MIHGLSSHIIINHRLTTQWLGKVQDAGVALVELFCARQSFDYRDESQIADVAGWFRDQPLRPHSIHLPMHSDDCKGQSGPHAWINIADMERIRRRDSVDELKRALEVAERIPVKFAIQHVGLGAETHDDRKLESAARSLEELNVFARDRGVDILVENIPNEMSSGERLRRFVESFHLKNGFCLDTGHANLMEGVRPAFDAMGDRIRSTHVHDNDGAHDSHLFPYIAEGGTIDWRRAMNMLRSREQQYPLLLELREAADIPDSLDAVRRVFDRLENERPYEEDER